MGRKGGSKQVEAVRVGGRIVGDPVVVQEQVQAFRQKLSSSGTGGGVNEAEGVNEADKREGDRKSVV